METKTLTLTEFLLARIFEDEAEIQFLLSLGERFPVDERKLLAECEAKRLIAQRAAGEPGDLADQRDIGVWEGCVQAAEYLATIYADHPDYRDEWRP